MLPDHPEMAQTMTRAFRGHMRIEYREIQRHEYTASPIRLHTID